MKKKWWLLFLLPVLVWVSVYFGFYFYVKYKVDTIILRLSAQSDIHYERIKTDLQGHIKIDEISITPLGQNRPINIDQIVIQTQSVWNYMLEHNPITGHQGPPNPFLFRVESIEIDLNESLAKSLDEWEAASFQEYDQKLDMCRPGGGINFDILRKLGFVNIEANAEFYYQFMPEKNRFELRSKLDIKDMILFESQVVLANIDPSHIDNWLTIALDKLNIRSHTHPILGQRISAFCAAKLGMKKKEYHRLKAVEFVHDLAQKGILLGQGLKKAVQDYFTNWGRIEIGLNPNPPINLLTLLNVKPDQIEKRLGLSILLDGSLVNDLSFELKKELILPDKKEQNNQPVHYIKKWVYHPIPLNRLEQYKGHIVRLTNNEGVIYEGFISDINTDVVSLEKKLSGGRFIAHFSRRKLVSAELKMRKKIRVK